MELLLLLYWLPRRPCRKLTCGLCNETKGLPLQLIERHIRSHVLSAQEDPVPGNSRASAKQAGTLLPPAALATALYTASAAPRLTHRAGTLPQILAQPCRGTHGGQSCLCAAPGTLSITWQTLYVTEQARDAVPVAAPGLLRKPHGASATCTVAAGAVRARTRSSATGAFAQRWSC
jgi:hypothetical protein